MRRRALLFALLAGGLVASGSVALSSGLLAWHGASTAPAAIARGELADVTPPAAVSRPRDHAGHEHDAGRDVALGLTLAIALTLAGGWWLTRLRAGHLGGTWSAASWRTRAPPRRTVTVHC